MKTKYTDHRGIVWHPYSVEFESPDGRFGVHLWAISDEHAQLQLASLKENGKVEGQIIEITPA